MKTILRLSAVCLLALPGSSAGEDCHDYSQHMHYVTRTLPGDSIEDLVLHGPYAMAVGWEAGFQVVDVADPMAPQPVGEPYMDRLYPYAVDVDGDLAAVAGVYGEGGKCGEGYQYGVLQLVDTADPLLPRSAGRLIFRFIPTDVAIAGDYTYLTMGDLFVADVSDPNAPVFVGDYPFIDAKHLIVMDGYALVINELDDNASVLQVLDLTDPTAPEPIGSLVLNWTCLDLTIEGN